MAFIIFIIYAFCNFIFMLWYGIGGHQYLGLGLMEPRALIISGYLLIEIFFVYVALIKFSRKIRRAAHLGFFAPWGLMLLIAIPQKTDHPEETLFLMFWGALILLIRLPAEMILGRVKAVRRTRSAAQCAASDR